MHWCVLGPQQSGKSVLTWTDVELDRGTVSVSRSAEFDQPGRFGVITSQFVPPDRISKSRAIQRALRVEF